jgi:hypothetical protein
LHGLPLPIRCQGVKPGRIGAWGKMNEPPIVEQRRRMIYPAMLCPFPWQRLLGEDAAGCPRTMPCLPPAADRLQKRLLPCTVDKLVGGHAPLKTAAWLPHPTFLQANGWWAPTRCDAGTSWDHSAVADTGVTSHAQMSALFDVAQSVYAQL